MMTKLLRCLLLLPDFASILIAVNPIIVVAIFMSWTRELSGTEQNKTEQLKFSNRVLLAALVIAILFVLICWGVVAIIQNVNYVVNMLTLLCGLLLSWLISVLR